MSIEIANESGADIDETRLAMLARHVLDEMAVHPLAELSVLLVDEAAMTELHVRWMGESGPTDVLAFPMDELRPPQPGGTPEYDSSEPNSVPGLLGDVVICPPVAAAQARRAGHGVQDEIDLLCAHGILHLLGYDHSEPAEHAVMFGLQDRLLAAWRAERGHGDHTARSGADSAGGEGTPADGGGAAPEAGTRESAPGVGGQDDHRGGGPASG